MISEEGSDSFAIIVVGNAEPENKHDVKAKLNTAFFNFIIFSFIILYNANVRKLSSDTIIVKTKEVNAIEIFSSAFLLVSTIALYIYIRYLEICHLAWFNADYYYYCVVLLVFSIYCFVIDLKMRLSAKDKATRHKG